MSDDVEKVKEEIKKGIDVNIQNELNETALHIAAEHGKMACVTMCLPECTFVYFVFIFWWLSIYSLFAAKPFLNTIVFVMILGGLKVAEFLIANGSQVDAVNSFKSTPLHKAAYYGKF